jgi:hypothetical protein
VAAGADQTTLHRLSEQALPAVHARADLEQLVVPIEMMELERARNAGIAALLATASAKRDETSLVGCLPLSLIVEEGRAPSLLPLRGRVQHAERMQRRIPRTEWRALKAEPTSIERAHLSGHELLRAKPAAARFTDLRTHRARLWVVRRRAPRVRVTVEAADPASAVAPLTVDELGEGENSSALDAAAHVGR